MSRKIAKAVRKVINAVWWCHRYDGEHTVDALYLCPGCGNLNSVFDCNPPSLKEIYVVCSPCGWRGKVQRGR